MNKQSLYEELSESLPFSKHDLDEAILQHSELYFATSEQYAVACSLRDEAKKLMEETYAKSNIRIRDQLSNDGKKVTEDFIKQLTLLDEEYKEATNKFLKCKLTADLWGILKESYSSRGYMIKEIAELWRASYFSTTAITSSSTVSGDLQYEAARALISEKRLLKKR